MFVAPYLAEAEIVPLLAGKTVDLADNGLEEVGDGNARDQQPNLARRPVLGDKRAAALVTGHQAVALQLADDVRHHGAAYAKAARQRDLARKGTRLGVAP